MRKRATAQSSKIKYKTANCTHCEETVFVDDEEENVDNLPEGVNVVIGGGYHLSVDTMDNLAAIKDHRSPKSIIKWFLDTDNDQQIDQQYMCPSCASSVYGFEK